MEKIKLLPSELYSFTYPDISDFLKVKTSISKESFQKNYTEDETALSVDSYLHKKKVYSKLFNWIDSCINQVIKFEEFQCESLKITQSWATKNKYGEKTQAHHHANSIISGIFYLTEGEPTCFATNNIWYFGSSPINFQSLKFEKQAHYVRQNPSQLLLFPSSLSHMVNFNKTQNLRYTIAFNTWMNGNWGDEKNLRRVNIEVL